jgi:hypothetical protein
MCCLLPQGDNDPVGMAEIGSMHKPLLYVANCHVLPAVAAAAAG